MHILHRDPRRMAGTAMKRSLRDRGCKALVFPTMDQDAPLDPLILRNLWRAPDQERAVMAEMLRQYVAIGADIHD